MKIKICGITTADVMQFCCDAGVDFVGCVFVEKSPRYIPPEFAKSLIDSVPSSIKTVGLFQDFKIQQVIDITLHTNIDYIQLHGAESVAYIQALQQHLDTPIIKAFGISEPKDFEAVGTYDKVCDILLFDAKPPPDSPVKGGHGVAFNWDILQHMPVFTCPWFLAGGITPDNARDAIKIPYVQMLDVSGGVEKAKGIKDTHKIQQLIKICKALQK